MADLVYPPVIVALKTFWKYLGLRFDSEGVEHIPREGGAILAMNHIGYLDFALIGTCALPVKRYVRFMAKKELFENKIAGPRRRRRTFESHGDWLDNSLTLVIYNRQVIDLGTLLTFDQAVEVLVSNRIGPLHDTGADAGRIADHHGRQGADIVATLRGHGNDMRIG